jgi:dTDP-4-dehydrorhamnose 3,5-epimerase
MPFTFTNLALPGLVLVEPAVFPDTRGTFLETFKASEFRQAGLPDYYVQDNLSRSKKDVIRGLHYQREPKAQGKLISVVKGRVLDVAVDIRQSSSTFLKWAAVELDDQMRRMLYIPPGFAHGFLAMTDEVLLHYKCTNEYDPAADAGIRWNDPDIAIDWPVSEPILSAKDAALPFVKQILT